MTKFQHYIIWFIMVCIPSIFMGVGVVKDWNYWLSIPLIIVLIGIFILASHPIKKK